MKNACKTLMKVDEFLLDILQQKKKNSMPDTNKINQALTDLRDAVNMLNK